jgi:chromosome segregation ATPase
MIDKQLTLSQRYELAQNELQQLSNLIARIDEKVDIFSKKHDVLDEKFGEHVEFCPIKQQMQEVLQRITALESHGSPALKKELDEDMQTVDEDIEEIITTIETIKDKQKQLELELQAIQIHSKSHDSFWKILGNFTFQTIMSLIWVIIAIVLYHFGIPPAPTKP